MQLVAYLNGERVDATQMAHEPWRDLVNDPDYEDLVLIECGLRASRVTRRGRQFFKHYRVADCTIEHKSESDQHLVLKRALQDRINATDGWRAEVEHAHPERAWIADVMAIHTSNRRLAFEVQLSAQSEDEYIRRTQRYLDDGVAPVWVVPDNLDWFRVKLPMIVTGFGKTSDLPAVPAALMGPTKFQPVFGRLARVGAAVDAVLHPSFRWRHGTPRHQLDEILRVDHERAERETAARKEAERLAEEKRLADEEAAARSASRELAFVDRAAAPDVIRTPAVGAGMNIWASIVQCGSGHRMLIWRVVAPPARVDSRPYRPGPEKFPHVQSPVSAWLEAEGVGLAKGKLVTVEGRGQPQAFSCPDCKEVVQWRWMAALPQTKWALVAEGIPSSAGRRMPAREELQTKRAGEPRQVREKTPPPARLPAQVGEADRRFIGPRRKPHLPYWMTEARDAGEMAQRLAAKEAHAARMEQLRANPRYRVSPNGFRFECTDCGGEFEDDNEGIHAGARCLAPGVRRSGWR